MYHTRHELTFAGLDAVEPRMIEFCIARVSTLVKPSTSGTATTELAVAESTTLGTFATGFNCGVLGRCFYNFHTVLVNA